LFVGLQAASRCQQIAAASWAIVVSLRKHAAGNILLLKEVRLAWFLYPARHALLLTLTALKHFYKP
jgi:hypothetical protein